MSMNGEYLRVTPEELDRALKDPAWALELVEEIQDEQEKNEPAPAEARHFTTDKAWDLVGFLLRRAGFPVDLVRDGQPFADDEDWGYGPPRYLTVEQVRLAAEALGGTGYDRLIDGVDPSELAEAEIYPAIWDSPESLEWARWVFPPLTEFVRAAAVDGDAMLLWIA
ncbi:YfbM family protein [Kitasatospora sp. NPDC093806]|uniref:YfbM family protein n=1 Tax=Kitasatospora sp. NPDC093806 TaxID=3155075 RepID=UPI00343DC359